MNWVKFYASAVNPEFCIWMSKPVLTALKTNFLKKSIFACLCNTFFILCNLVAMLHRVAYCSTQSLLEYRFSQRNLGFIGNLGLYMWECSAWHSNGLRGCVFLLRSWGIPRCNPLETSQRAHQSAPGCLDAPWSVSVLLSVSMHIN